MRILGIDPGTAIVGFGLIDKTGDKLKFLDAGVIRTPKTDAMPVRLMTIFDEITQLIDELKPDQAAIEQLFFARNVTTALTVGQARGVALLALQKANLPIGEYTPLQVKQAITTYGRAEKKQIQEMVKILLGLDSIPKPDDAADGLAIAITHSMQMSTNI
jgi:crossover junction endodeoxyribonuclease RuvC